MTWYQDLEPPIRDEADFIVREFAEHHIDIGGVPTENGLGVAFMYAEGQLLARERYLEPIQEVLADRAQAEVVRRVIKDIVLLKISFPAENHGRPAESDDSASESDRGNSQGDDRPPEGNGEQPALLALLDEIDARLGPGIATLDHVLTVAGNPSPCPATEPQEVYDPVPYPPVCPAGGDRVLIYVADTGVFHQTVTTTSWLGGVTGDNDPRIAADGTILPYGGHGTFVAGVIRCLAPDAQIVVKNVFNIAGSQLESNFVPDLYEGFSYGAEIFHLTVASPTRHNLPLIAFEAWMEDLHQHKGVVCVVAAGNSDSRLPHWPAAFPGMVSVGALSADWRSRAYFSNYGGWVDVYAPGQNLVNAFATGPYKCHVAPYAGEIRHFDGMAQWSGTSFSSPIVTGLIAARMARCGDSGKEAAAALLAGARAQTIQGVGPVLFPGCCDDERCGPRGEGGGDCGCGSGCGCGWGCGSGCGCHGDRRCEGGRRR
jgi:subtilisin family serine protease